MSELQNQLYEALRTLDTQLMVSAGYAGKENLGRIARRALQAFRAKRREQQITPAIHRLHPRVLSRDALGRPTP